MEAVIFNSNRIAVLSCDRVYTSRIAVYEEVSFNIPISEFIFEQLPESHKVTRL